MEDAKTPHLLYMNGNSLTDSTVFGKGVTQEYQMLQAQMKASSSK